MGYFATLNPIPTCSARPGLHAGTAQRAQSMLCEFPVSPPAIPLKGREFAINGLKLVVYCRVGLGMST